MKYLNALNKINGIGQKTQLMLFNHFGSGEKIWNATYSKLANAGLSSRQVQLIDDARRSIDPDKEWQILEHEEIRVIAQFSPEYPQLLLQTPCAPLLLYIKGNVDCLLLPSIAIVGSRKFTPYGKQVAHALSRDLSQAGVCVVSGLALGIDAIAHEGAIEVRGKTIAVLGNSLDSQSIAPRYNYHLSQEIIRSGGLLISQFSVPTSANHGTFPARNHIMAGLSLGTLVVEAAEKSGSLITANLALDFNRDVFAVPGSIFSPTSSGTHALIKRGAKLVTNVTDILQEMRIQQKPSQSVSNFHDEHWSLEEKLIMTVLSPDPTHIDRIIKLTKLETSSLSGTLTMLEIKGLAKNIGGQNYIRL